MPKALDLTDQRFGKLKAVSKADERGVDGSVRWHCVCDCGTLVIKSANALRFGAVTSCGCSKTAEDLTGRIFGRWTVMSLHAERLKNGGTTWVCECECGTTAKVTRNNLIRGLSKSCGCLKNELSSARITAICTTHGMTGSPEYLSWAGMIQRCYNPNHDAYIRYGGSGITVCDEWRGSFEKFYADMGERPSEEHTLDREDNEGNYTPDNCRWATWHVQQNNRKDTKKYLFNGGHVTLAEIARDAGVGYFPLYNRVVRKKIAIQAAIDELPPIEKQQ